MQNFGTFGAAKSSGNNNASPLKPANCLSEACRRRRDVSATGAPQRSWHTYLAKYKEAFAGELESNKLRTTTTCLDAEDASPLTNPISPLVPLTSTPPSRLTKKAVYGRSSGQLHAKNQTPNMSIFVKDAKCGAISGMAPH